MTSRCAAIIGLVPDVPTLDALVTVINAVAAGAALIIHAWGHTHPSSRPRPADPRESVRTPPGAISDSL